MLDLEKFRILLDEQMSYPDYYVFKFITHCERKHLLVELLRDHKIEEKPSKNGKYISITSRKLVENSHEVVDVYLEVGKIEGIITL